MSPLRIVAAIGAVPAFLLTAFVCGIALMEQHDAYARRLADAHSDAHVLMTARSIVRAVQRQHTTPLPSQDIVEYDASDKETVWRRYWWQNMGMGNYLPECADGSAVRLERLSATRFRVRCGTLALDSDAATTSNL